MELKKGMKVCGELENGEGHQYTGVVHSVGNDGDDKIATIKRDDGVIGGGEHIDNYGNGWRVYKKNCGEWCSAGYEGKLIILGKQPKEKPDDMIRYMVYGFGCNNKSNLLMTEDELKEELKKYSKDTAWEGRVIGYKMIPLFEAQEKTYLKSFKIVKRKKTKKVRQVKRRR